MMSTHPRKPVGGTTIPVIKVLQTQNEDEVKGAVSSFSKRYADDWERWLQTDATARPELFVRTLGKWQAARPYRLRRLRARCDEHDPPYIEDLLAAAEPHVQALSGFLMGRTGGLSDREPQALSELWSIFARLPQKTRGSSVAITKAVMLVTDGAIGPALDSRVRGRLRCGHVQSAEVWINLLGEVSADTRAFELTHAPLSAVVEKQVQGLKAGRLYEMALGPR